jgi:hypothetical protein
MMTSNLNPDLARFGDQLEAAAERSLRGARRRRIRRASFGVTVLTVLAAGTAVATGVFSPRQVAAGLPAGAMIFGGTQPTCSLDSDGVTYHCTLANPPAPDGPGEPPPADFRDAKHLIAIDEKIAGGCVGQDKAGLVWDCYVGSEAVKHLILTEDLLGQPALEPGRG